MHCMIGVYAFNGRTKNYRGTVILDHFIWDGELQQVKKN